MSVLAPTRPTTIVPDSPHREPMADFVRWATAQLEAGDRDEPQVDSLHAEGLSTGDLFDQLRAAGPAVHVRPVDHPVAVGDISPRLFDAYRVDGGQIQLAGCQLMDVPFVRLSYTADEDIVRHVFVSQKGELVPAELVEQLGLMDVEPIITSPSRIDGATLEELIATARRAIATSAEPLAVAVVWAKHAAGKLQFTVGEATADLPFAGWATLLAAPPFVGPHSHRTGFHLAATDDGRIDLASEIAACEQSGRRVLVQELATCCVTGKRVLPEFTDKCPVTGSPALVDQFATCAVCRERVSKAALGDETCAACRGLARIKKDDPRMVWIVGAHPGLARWSRWRLSETESVYVTVAQGFMTRLLVVVDKRSLAVRHLATASRISPGWRTVSTAEMQKFLA